MATPSVILASIVGQDVHRFNSTMLHPIIKSDFHGLLKTSNEYKYVWGLTPSKNHLAIWERMLPGDYIFFQINDHFRYFSIIAEKMDSKEIAQILWQSSHLFAESFKLLILFKNLYSISIPNHKFEMIFELELPNPSMPRTFFTDVNHEIIEKVISKSGSIQNALGIDKIVRRKLKSGNYVPDIIDYREPPAKRGTFVTRYIRDTPKSIRLKEKYANSCQICNYRIRFGPHNYYSEVHHIWPLSEGGYDNYDNMIVICPNHHAEFDLAVIAIDPKDGKTIIDTQGHSVGKLSLGANHLLKASNLKYQIKRMQVKRYDSKGYSNKTRLRINS